MVYHKISIIVQKFFNTNHCKLCVEKLLYNELNNINGYIITNSNGFISNNTNGFMADNINVFRIYNAN